MVPKISHGLQTSRRLLRDKCKEPRDSEKDPVPAILQIELDTEPGGLGG